MTSLHPPVTLQISLTHGDYDCAVHTIPHQLRQLGSQVKEILLTIDTGGNIPTNAGPYSRLMRWIESLRVDYAHLRAVNADYSQVKMRRVSQGFFGRERIPIRTSRGAFYAYFEGLVEATSDYVLHLDSDLFIGGGSSTWIQEAVGYLAAHPRVLICSPFPGPPRTDFELKTQSAKRLATPRAAYQFQSVSTRVFLLDRRRIIQSAQKLRLRRSAFRQQIRAAMEGFSPMALPEDLFTDYLQARGLFRVDFLGEKPGLWTLHPPYRSNEFFEKLPGIIQMVEHEILPEDQCGDFDLNDSMVNWSSARESVRRNRWWTRYSQKLRTWISH